MTTASDIAAWVALGWLICAALFRVFTAVRGHRSDGLLTSAASVASDFLPVRDPEIAA